MPAPSPLSKSTLGSLPRPNSRNDGAAVRLRLERPHRRIRRAGDGSFERGKGQPRHRRVRRHPSPPDKPPGYRQPLRPPRSGKPHDQVGDQSSGASVGHSRARGGSGKVGAGRCRVLRERGFGKTDADLSSPRPLCPARRAERAERATKIRARRPARAWRKARL